MTQNVGGLDRLVRILLGLALIWTALYVSLSTALVVLSSVVGLILVFTGITGFCWLYSLLKISTCKR